MLLQTCRYADHEATQPAAGFAARQYAPPDGEVSFALNDSLYRRHDAERSSLVFPLHSAAAEAGLGAWHVLVCLHNPRPRGLHSCSMRALPAAGLPSGARWAIFAGSQFC